ncbi:unnamed protein product [Rotaria sp. Silwood2]|nr:unnamed protein product [Rotaria sp. Silwood2]
MSFNLKDLKTNDQCDIMEADEESSFESYEIIDLNSRKILDHFLSVLGINNNTVVIDQILSQAQIINHSLERSLYITVHNKDPSVKLGPKTEYTVQAFESVYARTCTIEDGNCLYNSLSIINIGSEKLRQSMRLLAVNAMINNSDHFTRMSLCQPIYPYVKCKSDPKNGHYIPSDISIQKLIDQFDKGIAGGHLKYIGYKSDMNQLNLCIHFTGNHYDALFPFRNNPQQFIPKHDIIIMSV